MFNTNISILLSTYNACEFIENTIDRIINQTSKNFELIIVDDASSDATVEKIKSIIPDTLKCNIIINQSNLGVSKSREILLQNASFKYVTFLDHDDMLSLYFVEHFLSLLQAYGDKDFITSKYEVTYSLDRKKNLEETVNKVHSGGVREYKFNQEELEFPSPIWSKVFNKSIFDYETIENLKIISNLLYLEDISLPFYLLGKELNAISSDKVTYYHYRHDKNQSSRDLYGNYFVNQISLGAELLKLFESHNLTEVYESYLMDYTSVLIGIYSRYKFSKEYNNINLSNLEKTISQYSKRIKFSLYFSSYKAVILRIIGTKPVIFIPILKLYYNLFQFRRSR